MKVVLDANVIIAAFAARGLCESILEVCLTKHEIILSEDLLAEIIRNLHSKIKLPKNIIDQVVTLLNEFAVMVNPVPLAHATCRDPDDIKILELAVASKADYIITGDKDLLVLKIFQDIPILNPRSFSEILSGEGQK
jgi:uncharacterized protein